MTTETMVTLDEYFDLSEKEGGEYELLGGRLIEMGTPTFEHGSIQSLCDYVFQEHVQAKSLPFRVAVHTSFILSEDTTCAPDVCMIRNEKLRSLEVHRGALRGAPDLAVEIVSKHELAEDVEFKIRCYLEAGTIVVLVIHPRTRHIMIYHQTGEVRRLGENDQLELPGLLPGFKAAVERLFPKGN